MSLKTSEVEVTLSASPAKVWEVVTSSLDWGWRSDLRSRESQGTYSWRELYRWGLRIDFGVMDWQERKRYILHMENSRFRGQWSAHLEPLEDGGTRFRLRISLYPRNSLLWLMTLPFWSPEKYLNRYVADLKKRLDPTE